MDRSTARELLEERYARGELNRDEYLQKKRDLEDDQPNLRGRFFSVAANDTRLNLISFARRQFVRSVRNSDRGLSVCSLW